MSEKNKRVTRRTVDNNYYYYYFEFLKGNGTLNAHLYAHQLQPVHKILDEKHPEKKNKKKKQETLFSSMTTHGHI